MANFPNIISQTDEGIMLNTPQKELACGELVPGKSPSRTRSEVLGVPSNCVLRMEKKLLYNKIRNPLNLYTKLSLKTIVNDHTDLKYFLLIDGITFF